MSDRLFVRQLQVGSRDQELVTLLGEVSEKRNFAFTAPAEAGVTIKPEQTETATYIYLKEKTRSISS